MLYAVQEEPSEECLYVVLNDNLRAEDRRKLKPWFSYLKLLITSLSRLPSSSRRDRAVKKDIRSEYKTAEKLYSKIATARLPSTNLNGRKIIGKSTETNIIGMTLKMIMTSNERFVVLDTRNPFQMIGKILPHIVLHLFDQENKVSFSVEILSITEDHDK